ncbi:tubulin/FtsZ family protein [Haloplanus aerogenes]|uniref:Tubulin-like protein CetZ n=1 Tax=Haloplanus aerogenes TaxID=660522 RepID=A0A3M0DA52_9EURY|nr:tubulin/FtsZ family protein [Haloplanus aerogenes]AZH26058.1 cell division protein [Haloplanus aerogenes]RMB18492.1 cell division GTPase FtsZ [Haloplanus aerogenes]
MKLALVGAGQAGGKVMEAIMMYDRRAEVGFVADAIAVNTARADLVGLEATPLERRVLIGGARLKGHGTGADNELGADVARDDLTEVMRAVDDVAVHEIDAFLVIAGLGGGTGSGAAPVIARELRRRHAEPVYGLGILPSRTEGNIYTLNAARSFVTLVDQVDNLLLFDNDAWREGGESLRTSYDRLNAEIARRLGVLFSAGEVKEGQAVGESVVDASEIINTLGSGGISTLGYAATAVDRPKPRLFARRQPAPDVGDSTNRILTTVRRAALGRLTLPCELAGVERGLLVAAGPPAYLDRRGIERARRWLEETTGSMEIRGGDYPLDSGYVAAVVLLSGVSDVPRIEELKATAVETQQRVRELEADADAPEALRDLTWSGEADDGDEDLDPLF